MFPLPLHFYFEALALISSLVFWKHIRNTPLRWFVPYLLFIIAVELAGRYMIKVELRKSNAWLYNISVPIEYLFYGFIFYRSYKSRRLKKITLYFIGLYFMFCFMNILFVQGFRNFNTNILKAGNFFMMLACCLYFVELLASEDNVQILNEPMFWIASGIFLFNAGELFYALFSDYLIQNGLDNARTIFASINNKLIWVLYTCLAISFLCMKKPRKA